MSAGDWSIFRRAPESRTGRFKEKLRRFFVEEEDEGFEFLYVEEGWWQRTWQNVTNGSAAKQMVVGGGTGFLAGWLSSRFGRAAAGAVGGTMLVLQIAHHQGYVAINWGKLNNEAKRVQKRLDRRAKESRMKAVVQEIKDFVSENMFLAGGFASGFFLGLST